MIKSIVITQSHAPKQQRTTWLCNLCEPFLNFDPRISHQIKSKSKIRHNNISFGQSRKHTSGDDSFYRRFQRWEIRKHQTKQTKKLHAHLSSAKFKYTTFCSPVSTCSRATTKKCLLFNFANTFCVRFHLRLNFFFMFLSLSSLSLSSKQWAFSCSEILMNNSRFGLAGYECFQSWVQYDEFQTIEMSSKMNRILKVVLSQWISL